MLSEKAKGKQRAIDPETKGSSVQQQSRDLTIRFTEGISDLVLHVTQKDSVRDVKAKIATARPQLKDRRLRLIHAGRLLTDGTLLHSWLTTLEERQQRASPSLSGDVSGAPAVSHMITWLHCSIGPKMEPGTETEEKHQVAQLQPLRGFDRLATAGFSEEDIANFRRQFHSQSSSNYLDIEFENDEEYDEHARALEEQWIDSMDSVGSAPLVQSSSQTMIVRGIVIGFFFPIIPFFFLRDTKPAAFWEDGSQVQATESVIFSRRTQVGIVFGFIVNLLFGTWRYLLDTS
ncbi:hypothetical protein HYDPIDRAFT_111955 [Hydnomerulius pinastri MD-312]|uniref:Ubiquitin-like domain-containing protein n=1 Tax=Hydnomerulius pinastri MD-312 TaxID=994086 RepID=A0A0C9W9T5_9AGAM|nr:hypothetical protein HYDPIDRAFT_111955 [Hydnomerulius pinastri MD-312]